MSILLEEDKVESDGQTGRVRKVIVRSTWKADQVTSMMETEFTPFGRLRETRFSSLVPAVNTIPCMDKPPAEAGTCGS
jgi:hypothetical protein